MKVAPKISCMLGNLVGARSFAHCEGMERVPKRAGISSAWCGAPPSCSPTPTQNAVASRALVAPIPLTHPTVLWVGWRMLCRCCALHRLSSRRNSAIPTHLQIHVEQKEKTTCCNATNFYGYGVVKARTYFPNAWMEAFDMEWTPEFSSLRVPDRIVKSL